MGLTDLNRKKFITAAYYNRCIPHLDFNFYVIGQRKTVVTTIIVCMCTCTILL